jgi:hypothetical protein
MEYASSEDSPRPQPETRTFSVAVLVDTGNTMPHTGVPRHTPQQEEATLLCWRMTTGGLPLLAQLHRSTSLPNAPPARFRQKGTHHRRATPRLAPHQLDRPLQGRPTQLPIPLPSSQGPDTKPPTGLTPRPVLSLGTPADVDGAHARFRAWTTVRDAPTLQLPTHAYATEKRTTETPAPAAETTTHGLKGPLPTTSPPGHAGHQGLPSMRLTRRSLTRLALAHR